MRLALAILASLLPALVLAQALPSSNGSQPRGGNVVPFPDLPRSGVARTLAPRPDDVVNAKAYGAIADGNSHPLSERYGSLAEARAVCPSVASLDIEIDWCAIQAAIDTRRPVFLPDGYYVVNATLSQTNNGTLIYGPHKDAVQIRRHGDFGPTFSFGGTSTVLNGSGLRGVAIYDFGGLGQFMTRANSPFHIVADNTQQLRLEGLLIATANQTSHGGGIRLLGSIDYRLSDVYVWLLNGAASGKVGILIGKSAIPGAIAPAGGLKAELSAVNVEGGVFNRDATAITSFLDYGIKVESGDGLWMSGVHVQGAQLANLSIAPTRGNSVYNVYIANTMLDITNGHGLVLGGAGGVIDRLDFRGRVSAAGAGTGNVAGVRITGAVENASLDLGVDGFRGNCIEVDSPTVRNLVFKLGVLTNCNIANEGYGGLSILAASRVQIIGGLIGGERPRPRMGFGVKFGPGASNVVAVGVNATELRPGGYGLIIDNGAKGIAISGGSVLGVTNPVADISAPGAGVTVLGVLGANDFSKR